MGVLNTFYSAISKRESLLDKVILQNLNEINQLCYMTDSM